MRFDLVTNRGGGASCFSFDYCTESVKHVTSVHIKKNLISDLSSKRVYLLKIIYTPLLQISFLGPKYKSDTAVSSSYQRFYFLLCARCEWTTREKEWLSLQTQCWNKSTTTQHRPQRLCYSVTPNLCVGKNRQKVLGHPQTTICVNIVLNLYWYFLLCIYVNHWELVPQKQVTTFDNGPSRCIVNIRQLFLSRHRTLTWFPGLP